MTDTSATSSAAVPLPSRRWPTLRRDTILWLLGLSIAIHETILQPKAQAEVLVFAAGLLGLPGILAANELAKKFVAAADAIQQQPSPPPPSESKEG